MSHGDGVEKGDNLHMNQRHHLERPYWAQLSGRFFCTHPLKSVREGLKRKKERKKEKKITEVVTHGQANFLLSYVESV